MKNGSITVQEWPDWSELTDRENQTIRIARNLGFSEFFPAFPDTAAQARNTLAAADRFLLRHAQNCTKSE